MNFPQHATVAWLPVLCLSGSPTTGLPRSFRLPISLFTAVDAATEGILAEVVFVKRRSRFTALPLLLDHLLTGPDRLRRFVGVVVRRRIPGRPGRPLRRLLLAVSLVH